MPNIVRFFPLNAAEQQEINRSGIQPKHCSYACGACSQITNGRILAEIKRECDGATVEWCVCTCPREEPTVVIERGGVVTQQIPDAREFQASTEWPQELAQLYEEAGKSYAAGAYTAAAMVARKLLMACACREGATDGDAFIKYVDYITGTVLTFPKAKDAIDKIRSIGNEANHNVKFVSRDDSRRALSIVTYMLNTIYSLPSA
jgi:hypothetical protein